MPVETIQVPQYICSRCNHRWQSREGKKPRMCPECKTQLWNVPPATKREERRAKANGWFFRRGGRVAEGGGLL